MFKIGDYVIIKENSKVLYKIEKINENICILKGLTIRTKKEALLKELEIAPQEIVDKALESEKALKNNLIKSTKLRSKNFIYGTILHIDGDEEYLNSCLDLYKEIGIFANGIYMNEENVQNNIENLLLDTTPDIIVITGHDAYNGKGLKDLDNYQNTKYFIKALRKIRKHFNQDSLVVVIGACASNFEALIANGANFSSSPKRINIHTYDPAIIAIKIATTSNNQYVDFDSILKFIENKKDAFGGIETKGKMKILL